MGMGQFEQMNSYQPNNKAYRTLKVDRELKASKTCKNKTIYDAKGEIIFVNCPF